MIAQLQLYGDSPDESVIRRTSLIHIPLNRAQIAALQLALGESILRRQRNAKHRHSAPPSVLVTRMERTRDQLRRALI